MKDKNLGDSKNRILIHILTFTAIFVFIVSSSLGLLSLQTIYAWDQLEKNGSVVEGVILDKTIEEKYRFRSSRKIKLYSVKYAFALDHPASDNIIREKQVNEQEFIDLKRNQKIKVKYVTIHDNVFSRTVNEPNQTRIIIIFSLFMFICAIYFLRLILLLYTKPIQVRSSLRL